MLRRSLIPVLIAIFVAALVSAASRAEPLSNLSIDNVTVTEGAVARTPRSRSRSTRRAAWTSPSTTRRLTSRATAGEDYADTSGQVTIPAGETEASISVPVLDDTLDEADDEIFTVTLTNAVGGGILDGEGDGDDHRQRRGTAALHRERHGHRGRRLRHHRGHASTSRWTRRAARPSSSTTRPPTAPRRSRTTTPRSRRPSWCSRRVRPRSRRRSSSTATRSTRSTRPSPSTWRTPSEATIGDGQAVGTITDDDGPAISIDNVSVTEGNAGTVTADFTLTPERAEPAGGHRRVRDDRRDGDRGRATTSLSHAVRDLRAAADRADR